jgi:hypothetical protein
MLDIYLGLAITGGLSVVAFGFASVLSRQASIRLCNLLAITLVLCLVLFIRDLWSSQAMAQWLPFSNLIVVGNWMAPTVAMLGGLAWRRVPGRFFRKSLLIGTMLGIAGYSLWHPLSGQVPRCTNVWRNGVCIQSTSASCSPASAATLLRWYRIPTTEQEMAELCLTRYEGTYWQGLYRGLKLKTAGTPWDVQVFATRDLEELREKTTAGPAILTVGLVKNAECDPIYQTEWGWVPGVSHSVVLFHFGDDEHVRIGDPSVEDGQETWTRKDLEVLWQGYGLRLVPRSGETLRAAARHPAMRSVSRNSQVTIAF